MVQIQLNLPKDIDTELKVFSAREGINDKRKAIIQILRDKFKKGTLK